MNEPPYIRYVAHYKHPRRGKIITVDAVVAREESPFPYFPEQLAKAPGYWRYGGPLPAHPNLGHVKPVTAYF